MNDRIQPKFPLQSSIPVFERLGVIVRALHDTLSEIGAQNVLTDAVNEFPSARERLVHIGELTEKAANLVLGKVEQQIPLLDRLANKAAALEEGWRCAAASAPLAPEHAQIGADTQAFLAQVKTDCASTHVALSDIMMAQDFQDLTGQLIKKVVTLLERTENDLLKLLIDAAPSGTMTQVRGDEVTAGPGAPGGIALNQNSVDDLLADLGF